MWGCRRIRMYSTSFRTRDFAFPFWIFPFGRHFIATLVPVTVCIASGTCHQLVVSWVSWVPATVTTDNAPLTIPKVPSAMSATILYSPNFRHGSSCDGGVGFGGSLAIGSDQEGPWLCYHLLPPTHPQDVRGLLITESATTLSNQRGSEVSRAVAHMVPPINAKAGGPLDRGNYCDFNRPEPIPLAPNSTLHRWYVSP